MMALENQQKLLSKSASCAIICKNIFLILVASTVLDRCSAFLTKPFLQHDRKFNHASFSSMSMSQPEVYTGPFLSPIISESEELTAGINLAELGIDLFIGPSAVSPGLGLFVRCSEGIDSVTLPECTLLCGYAKSGSFGTKDLGDKTVGFSLRDGDTAVFYDKQLMTIGDALQKAAVERGDGSCGLAGHDILLENEKVQILPTAAAPDGAADFARYFIPDLFNSDEGTTEDDLTIQNFGQFCNDLAWATEAPPATADEYTARSAAKNCVQLVWRLAFDEVSKCLVPSWPVSVLAYDKKFENQDFMEVGTRYGFGYWQATVDLDSL